MGPMERMLDMNFFRDGVLSVSWMWFGFGGFSDMPPRQLEKLSESPPSALNIWFKLRSDVKQLLAGVF